MRGTLSSCLFFISAESSVSLSASRGERRLWSMDDRIISEVVKELEGALVGRAFGKVFQLSRASLAIDFRLSGDRLLFISADPAQPRLHLASRKTRELERASVSHAPFSLLLRKTLGGASLESIIKDEGDRIVRFKFEVLDALGEASSAHLVAQLTGRTSNLFLLDDAGRVIDTLRPSRGEGQQTGDLYAPPVRSPDASQEASKRRGASSSAIPREGFATLSEALDHHYGEMERAKAFKARASSAASKLRREGERLRKLRDNLARDLSAHGDPEEHKRVGDLLLANLSTAERTGSTVRLTDYYADDAPLIEIEVDENSTLQEAAAERFSRYAKAKRAAQEINARLAEVAKELLELEERRAALEAVVASGDEDALALLTGERRGEERAKRAKKGRADSKRGRADTLPGVRRYRSSDGYEVLVGRASRDNDHLTFRLARSHDLWLHAADYPGSHVVVRARKRDEEIPHRTVVEAAELAAHFSQARKDAKVAVNYTPRKFISKPKGASPGLVYLSAFKTILVEPREALERT